MKCAIISAIFFFVSGIISSGIAQNNPVVNKKMKAPFDILLMDMKKIDVTKPEEVKKSIPVLSRDQIFDATLPALNSDIDQRKTEIETKNRQNVNNKSGKAHLIDKDLLALMTGIPEPISWRALVVN